MRLYRRAVQRLLNYIRLDIPKIRSGTHVPPGPVEGGVDDSVRSSESTRMSLSVASELWQQGEHENAFDVLRRARLEQGPTAELQFLYGKWAYAEGHTWAAREALHDAVKMDPTHLDALELFLEANHVVPAAKGSATAAISTLAGLLPYSDNFDLDATTLILPSARMIEIVDQKVRMIRYSESTVAAHLGTLAVMPTESWMSWNDSGSVELLEAKIVVTLSRREYDIAYKLLETTPVEAKPKRALRLAIRKELRNEQKEDARLLLEHYREIAPEDRWATKQLETLTNSNSFLSNYELTIKGFPFPARTSEAVYAPKRNHILYLLHTSLPLHSVGYATRSHGLLRGIRSHGWDVQGVTRLGYPYDMPHMESLGNIEPKVVIDDVPYQRLSTEERLEKKNPIQGYVARYSAALQSMSLEEKPFAIHAASNHWNGLAGVSAALQLGIPSIYEVRGLWEITRGSRNPEWMGGPMYKYMARLETDAATNADRVITITDALREELISRGVDGNKITVVPNGVEISRFRPRERNRGLVQRLGVQSKTVIGYVGSILNYEGIELLIEAARRLKQERNDVAFVFVGDGAELEHYREKVTQERLSDVVTFTGRVSHHEVEEYYSVIDICPFPRLPLPVTEIVSPLKPFEAMAMEKAVVVSDVAALKEVIVDGSNGLTFTKGDVSSLTHKLRVLLDMPELRQHLAEVGREWVERERDWRKLSQKIGEIYESLGGTIADH